MSAKIEQPYDKNNPYLARITENIQLCKHGSSKDTRHFVVDLGDSGLTYTCGDSLGVFPRNRPEEVKEVIEALGATGDEPVTLPKEDEPMRLADALDGRLSIASPTPKALKAFQDKATDSAELAKLESLLAPENKDSTRDDYLYNRHFIDLLQEFPSAKFAPQEFVDLLRKLVPRLYSIASSPVKHPNEIHLTIATVRYKANERDRVGVCSTYLADRADLNEWILPVFVASSHFGLPEDTSVDLIMVGPGTGIAPFRAFVQERVATNAPGRNWVFFGDQHEKTDFLYDEEWKAYSEAGQVHKLSLAWSRDQAEKVYVQNKMQESAAEIWDWLEGGAYFYVCGDAKRMAKDVDATLHQIAHEQGGMSEDDAAAWVKQLKKDKRYQRDVY